ncbi:MAG: hypothetical protein OEM26_03790 [Saprospiraceae bacterium]|nr:hypothetical protein [Saprospiraceae bacterium]
MIDILGWLGSLELVVAYYLVSTKRLGPTTYLYQGLNLKGSVLLLINTAYYGAFPSSFVNFIWIIIAMVAIFQVTKRSSKS